MTQDVAEIRVQVDTETDRSLAAIAELEGRSKRKQTSFILARIVRAWKATPDKVKELGLVRPAMEVR